MLGNGGAELMGMTNQFLVQLEAHAMADTTLMARKQRQDSPETQNRTKHEWLKKKSMK